MQRRTKRWVVWVFAAVFLVVFCWLGVACSIAADVFHGFVDVLPVTTRVAMRWGTIGCPILGVILAIALVVVDLFSDREWLKLMVVAAGIIFMIFITRTLLFSPRMSPVGIACSAPRFAAISEGEGTAVATAFRWQRMGK
jgi:hypothetical protein